MTRKIASILVALAAAAALLTGCGASNPIQTAENYSASDGTRIELSNGIRFENFFFLTAEPGAAVRPMGSIVNGSSAAAEVSIDVEGHSASYTIEPNSVLSLETDGGVYDGITLTPGTNVATTVTSGGAVTHDVPVLDGTLPPYDEYLP